MLKILLSLNWCRKEFTNKSEFVIEIKSAYNEINEEAILNIIK